MNESISCNYILDAWVSIIWTTNNKYVFYFMIYLLYASALEQH